MKIGIITCAEHWRDGTSQEPDDQRLLVALGEQARCVRWSDPLTVWSEYDLCIVRSTWDYHKSREAFLSWARTIARVTSLWNPYEVIEWNTDKRYLRELEQQNVPTIPTMWLSAGTTVNLGWYLSHCGWQQAIMKPVVGAGSYGVAFLSQERLAEGQRCLDVLLRNRAVMLQPFYPSVKDYGERSLVFIANELTHAYRKGATFGDPRAEEVVHPAPDEAGLARDILRAAWRCIGGEGKPGFLFARVDLVRDEQGVPRLMELELTEPRLRLDLSSEALTRLIRAIRFRLPNECAALSGGRKRQGT